MSIYNINRCPACGSTHLMVSVKSWADFENGEPSRFDDEHLPNVDPIVGNEAICRKCPHSWPIAVEE